MPETAFLRPHVRAELARSREARRSGDHGRAWLHLERAHILSQPSARLHTRVHLVMLLFALRALDGREVIGQVVRVAMAGIGSLLGRYPAGNTGRARVSLFRPMPIPADLVATLERAARASSPPSPAGPSL